MSIKTKNTIHVDDGELIFTFKIYIKYSLITFRKHPECCWTQVWLYIYSTKSTDEVYPNHRASTANSVAFIVRISTDNASSYSVTVSVPVLPHLRLTDKLKNLIYCTAEHTKPHLTLHRQIPVITFPASKHLDSVLQFFLYLEYTECVHLQL